MPKKGSRRKRYTPARRSGRAAPPRSGGKGGKTRSAAHHRFKGGKKWLVLAVILLIALGMFALFIPDRPVRKPGSSSPDPVPPASSTGQTNRDETLPGEPAAPSTGGAPSREAASTNIGSLTAEKAPENEAPEGSSVNLLNRGNEMFHQQNYDEAIALYREALQVTPEDESAHFNLGAALAKKGQTEEAKQEYRKALEIFPDYTEAHNNLGNLLLAEGNHAGAIEHFQQAVDIFPDYAVAHNNLGKALAQSGRTDEAIQHFDKAIDLNPRYPEARYNLGSAYLANKDYEKAIEEYTALLEINPDFQPAQQALLRARELSALNPPVPLRPGPQAEPEP